MAAIFTGEWILKLETLVEVGNHIKNFVFNVFSKKFIFVWASHVGNGFFTVTVATLYVFYGFWNFSSFVKKIYRFPQFYCKKADGPFYNRNAKRLNSSAVGIYWNDNLLSQSKWLIN